jgi:hypothetical protein
MPMASPTSIAQADAPPPTLPAKEVINLTSLAAASASSVLAPEKTERFGVVRFDPGNILDHDPVTSWVEGVAGPGIGEQLVLGFSRPISVMRIGLDVGLDRDETIFYANNRVRSVRLIFSDGSTQSVEFRDQRGIQYVSIADVTTSSIAIVIADVYPGSKYDDTPIAEVEVWGYMGP